MRHKKFLIISCASLVMGCATQSGNETAPKSPGELASCPTSPNCVSSIDIGRSHYIDPIKISGGTDEVWQALIDMLSADTSITIVTSDDRYVRAEAKTRLFRFTDDVEFLLHREEGLIHMRSASRLGFYDLGKNRSRLEGIRGALQDAKNPD